MEFSQCLGEWDPVETNHVFFGRPSTTVREGGICSGSLKLNYMVFNFNRKEMPLCSNASCPASWLAWLVIENKNDIMVDVQCVKAYRGIGNIIVPILVGAVAS